MLHTRRLSCSWGNCCHSCKITVLNSSIFRHFGLRNCLGCFSFDCKLDLYVLDGNLTGQKYRDNVLAPCVVPHFDNHALTDRVSIFWHFGLRWLICRPVKSHTCSIGFISGDIAGHGIVWTASCCKKCCTIRVLCGLENIDELRTSILQEWQQFPQERLRRLVRSMMRRVTELHNKRDGYTRYW
jgi:hypothetical protein